MDKRDEELIRQLAETDEELRVLYDEHLVLEKGLAKLNGRLHLSTDEEREKREIQKRKLAGKDRIMEILSAHRS